MATEYVGGLCEDCGGPVKLSEPYSWREVHAFEMVSRTGGVTTRTVRKHYTGRVLCPKCGRGEGGQEKLF